MTSSCPPGDNATLYTHAGLSADPTTGAILTPIYQSTAYVQESVEKYLAKGYSYSRSGNPTVRSLEKKINAVEGGADAACFSTGMAATLAVLSTYLSAGSHCIMPTCVYGGTFRAANEYLSRFGVSFDFVDFRDPENVRNHIKENTKLIFVETPANPTLRLTDLEAIDSIIAENELQRILRSGTATAAAGGAAARGNGMNEEGLLSMLKGGKREKERSILYVVDSTFVTPVALHPLEYGADVVIHSTTKYFDGHNVTTGGVAVARFPEQCRKIAYTRNICGSIMDPQTAFYTLNSSVTLPLRIKRQSDTAKAVAAFLEKHPKVKLVRYPGLDSHPQRNLALKYHRGDYNGGVLGFEVKGGVDTSLKLMNIIGYPFSLGENLGPAQSLVTYPAVFTHSQLTKEQREAIDVTDGYIRLSIGLEEKEDLINALDKALAEI